MECEILPNMYLNFPKIKSVECTNKTEMSLKSGKLLEATLQEMDNKKKQKGICKTPASFDNII